MKRSIEEKVVSWWRENWDGLDSYERLVEITLWLSVGFGLGSLFAVKRLILTKPQHLTEALASDTRTVTELSISLSIGGIGVCLVALLVIDHFRSED